MASIGSASVRVNAETLIAQAGEVKSLGNDMKTQFQSLANIVQRMRNYWIGDAGDATRKLYDKQKDQVDVMLRRVLEHPDDLLKISGNYKAAEANNISTAQSLNADIIE